nr:hypothetical protein [Tanacetum cinerariifolium]
MPNLTTHVHSPCSSLTDHIPDSQANRRVYSMSRNYAYMPNALRTQATMLPQAFQTMTPQDLFWNMDTGASSHLADNIVRQFTRDDDVSVEFDAYGFSIKDYQTRRLLLRCDSTGDFTRLCSVTIVVNMTTPVFMTFSAKMAYNFGFLALVLRNRMANPSVEALNMVAHLLNILPSTAINNEIPFTKLYNQTLTYEHLRVFGCLCYPHDDVSHKLEPCSTPCIFLGYLANHRGYRCLDLASNKIIISRHVRFDEDIFPFENVPSSNKPTYDFLLPPVQTTINVPTTNPFVQHMDEPNNSIMPHLTTPPTSPPQPDTPPSHSSTPIPPQLDAHLSHNSTPILTSSQTQSHAQTVDNHILIPKNNSSQTMPTHPMVTRAKAGIFKPLERINCHVTTTSPLPRSHVHAFRDPNWKEAMLDEYNALITNGTWFLVPRPTNVNVVRFMWLFKHKFNADGSLSKYKARLVANECSQQQGIDCDETFILVVKPATIRTILSLVVSRDWLIHQLDVKNAFFHGHLSETVYMHQPPGFVDPNKPNYVCHLQRSLYGLKQAPPSSLAFLQRIITYLHSEFAMTDLGSRNYFLGISTQRSASGLFLSQSKLAEEIFERVQALFGCLYMHDPHDLHFTALKHFLRYVHGILDYDMHLYVSSTTELSAYTDADWADCPITRRSTSGYCVFFGDNLLSWSAKRHVTLSRSSAEAEYRGIANVVAETAWIHNLLREFHTPLFTATLGYRENVSDVYMSTNPFQHQRTKHIEIDIHFVCYFVASGQVSVLHVPSRF